MSIRPGLSSHFLLRLWQRLSNALPKSGRTIPSFAPGLSLHPLVDECDRSSSTRGVWAGEVRSPLTPLSMVWKKLDYTFKAVIDTRACTNYIDKGCVAKTGAAGGRVRERVCSQRYGPELDRRCRPHLRSTNDSWRVDETYIEVKGEWKCLYRAVDSQGNTLDFLLTAHRDAQAANRFLRKVLKAAHTQEPRVINVDKSPAYPKAIEQLKDKKELSKQVELRLNKYHYNRIEQDHRFIKRLVKPGMGFGSFDTARRTIKGYEIMNMLRKGQVTAIFR